MTSRQNTTVDELLRRLAEEVPGLRQAVVLSTDGRSLADVDARPPRPRDVGGAVGGRNGIPARAATERLAAASAAVRGLARAVATELSERQPEVRTVTMELAGGGRYFLVPAGHHAHLAVLCDPPEDGGALQRHVAAVALRIAELLPGPPDVPPHC